MEVVYYNGKRNVYYTIENNNMRFYYPSIIHKAKYDSDTGNYFFNDSFWQKNANYDDSTDDVESGCVIFDDNVIDNNNTNIQTFQSESRLASVRRYKKTIDDDGNTLQCIISEDGSMDTELPFKLGVSNIYLSDDGLLRGDIITNIILENNIGDEMLYLTYNTDGIIEILKTVIFSNNQDIPTTLNLNLITGEVVSLKYKKELNKYNYHWVEQQKTDEPNNNVIYNDTLSNPTEEDFNKITYLSANTDGVVSFYQYKCEIKETIASYIAFIEKDFIIRPSHIEKQSEGVITFNYICGCIINKQKTLTNNEEISRLTYEPNSGIIYSESYPYKITVNGINFTSPKEIEELTEHKYRAYDYELREGDVVINGKPNTDLTYNNVGEIYYITDIFNRRGSYKRILSEYKMIQIDFSQSKYTKDVSDVEKYRNNIILSNIGFATKQTFDDKFQHGNMVKDDFMVGIEGVNNNIDINVERGSSSAFERLHILSEIKTFNDLENYKNNYFKI